MHAEFLVFFSAAGLTKNVSANFELKTLLIAN